MDNSAQLLPAVMGQQQHQDLHNAHSQMDNHRDKVCTNLIKSSCIMLSFAMIISAY